MTPEDTFPPEAMRVIVDQVKKEDREIRTIALQAAVRHHGHGAFRKQVLETANVFADYIRTGAIQR